MKRNLSILIAAVLLSACSGHVDGGGGNTAEAASGGAAGRGSGDGAPGSSSNSDGVVNPCMAGQSTLIAPSATQDARSVATDGDNVYWTTWGEDSSQNGGMILTASIQDGVPAILATNEGTTTDIVADARNVYWVNYAQSLRVIPKTGGMPTTLAEGAVDRLAIDEAYVYFTTTTGIERVPISGGEAQLLVTDSEGPDSVAVDDAYVYWIDRGTTGDAYSSINRLAKAGGQPVVLATGGFRSSYDIGLDAANVYVSSTDAGTMAMVPKVGGSPVVMTTHLLCPDEVRVDSSGVYVSNNAVACANDENSSTLILRVSRMGGPLETVTNLQYTGIEGAFAVDSRNVYWAGYGPNGVPGSGIFCAAK